MSLKSRIEQEMKDAMKARAQAKLDVIRMLRSAIKNNEINSRTDESRAELDDAGVIKVVQTLVKQRQDSLALYNQGGREDLAAKEKAEIEYLQTYLPTQLSDADLSKLVAAAIAEAGATDVKDMGKVMKIVLAKAAGQADGKKINQLVQEQLKK